MMEVAGSCETSGLCTLEDSQWCENFRCHILCSSFTTWAISLRYKNDFLFFDNNKSAIRNVNLRENQRHIRTLRAHNVNVTPVIRRSVFIKVSVTNVTWKIQVSREDTSEIVCNEILSIVGAVMWWTVDENGCSGELTTWTVYSLLYLNGSGH